MMRVLSAFILASLICLSMVLASPTKLYVESVSDLSLNPDDTFSVNVKIDDVADLYGYDFKLRYDTNILDVLNVTEGPFLKSSGETYLAKNEIHDDGWVWFVVALTGTTNPAEGSGTLATITFKVMNRGESVLDLYETKISDRTAQSIPHVIEDGYFNNAETVIPTQTTISSDDGGGGGVTTTISQTTTTTTITTTIPTTQKEECKEDWKCPEWSECVNGKQARACVDNNKCGTTKDKPVESQDCVPKEQAKLPTGMFFSMNSNLPYLIVAIALAIVFIILVKVKSRKNEDFICAPV